jgi:hypothetical protein
MPAHSARTTQDNLIDNMAKFWIQAEWQPHSLDLNLLDFSIWNILQEKVQEMPHARLAALRWSVTKEWDRLLPAYSTSARPAALSADT